MTKKKKQLTQLEQTYESYLAQIERYKLENQELAQEIRSQSDPDYIELTLKKVLGLVPDGEHKVFFDN